MLPFANHHIIGTGMKMWRNRSIDLEKVRAAALQFTSVPQGGILFA
jgi:hypothetical protein